MKLDISKLVTALKTKREAEGLSLRKLSTHIGVSFSTLARIERGDGEPDNNSALRIIEWLGKDGEALGLTFDNVAMVHFRAAKNVSSKTIEYLLEAANSIKQMHGSDHTNEPAPAPRSEPISDFAEQAPSLAKTEMEQMAMSLRSDLSIPADAAVPALSIRIQGVTVAVPEDLEGLSDKCRTFLLDKGASEWSAMSVPLEEGNSVWTVLRNPTHTIERQRVTYLEECWHILLGHKLTKVARVAGAYGRSYENTEEHDAYYLASATLLPEDQVIELVNNGVTADIIGAQFGTSPELVEYRIKRLGLWRIYKGLQVQITPE
jgi:transcriptional regulator with XRE-family HTH domain